MEAGGYATSWSMRFQDLWAVRQSLRVLAGELQSVRIEAAGLEGQGVDLIVTRTDGTTEYQQCKRSNGHTGKWSLTALNNQGVILAICDRLRANCKATFRFISVDPAPDLRELCESARASLNAESFLRDQVDSSRDRKRSLEILSGIWRLTPERTEDLAQIYTFLQRCFTTLANDDSEAVHDLGSHARYWVDGDPETVVSVLESFVKRTLRTSITSPILEGVLESQGLFLRVLSRDSRTLPAVRKLQEKFEQSLQSHLVRGELLPREEADQLFDWIVMEKGPAFIAVHGHAGFGKSGVLLALTRRLQRENILFLPLRLDWQQPHGSTRKFGESLGLPESPALCLKALANGSDGVLILDQLDALRWTGPQAAEALNTCRQLVGEAIEASNLKVVACCRTYDLENDPQISRWIEQKHAQKLLLGRLSENTVRKLMVSFGVSPDGMSARQIDLLRTIQHLRTWEQLIKANEKMVDFATERDLLNEFWKSQLSEMKKWGVSEAAVQDIVDTVVSYMDRNGILRAPRRLLGRGLIEGALLSLRVFAVDGETTVEEWLTAGHQALFRREQLKLVLGLLRDEQSNRYYATLHGLLESKKVRFHLKQAVLQFLGQVSNPRPEELALVVSLLEEEQWQDHVIGDIYFGHLQWIDSARGIRFLEDWLQGEEWQCDQALRIIRSVIINSSEFCGRLLSPYVGRGDDWARRLAAVLPGNPAKDSQELFKLRVSLAEQGVEFSYVDWRGFEGPLIDRLVQLLVAILLGLSGRGEPLSRNNAFLRGLERVNFGDASVETLRNAWAALLPPIANVLGPANYSSFDFSVASPGERKFPLRELLRQLASELVSRVPLGTIDLGEKEVGLVSELLLLETFSHLEDKRLADQALEWLMASPHRLRLRWSSSDLPWKASRNVIELLTRACSPELFSGFEEFLIGFCEPRLLEEMKWRHEELLFPQEGQPRFSAFALARPTPAGETLYHLLSCLPKNRLSNLGLRRLREMQRKFGDVDKITALGWGRHEGPRESSLPQGRFDQLSDRAWLNIIGGDQSPRPSRGPARYRSRRFNIFAPSLQAAATREPGRFARLALGFPEHSNPAYLEAVLQGLANKVQDRAEGEDVSLQEVEPLLALAGVADEPDLAMAVAWLIAQHAQFNWGLYSLGLLTTIATNHPDPDPAELRLHGSDREDLIPENLVSKALNSTRGAATLAIANLLFADESRLPLLFGAIERLVLDPHPAVRSAAIECCRATLHVGPERSIAWALQAVAGNEALLASSTFERFLLCASRDHPDEMEGTIKRMLSSPREDVVCIGARYAMALFLRFGKMEEEVQGCIHGPLHRRIGAARTASDFMGAPEYHHQSRAILAELINDSEDKVLAACAEWLRKADALDLLANSPEFPIVYAGSRAFRRHPAILLESLKDQPGSLIPFASCVLEACRNISTSGRDERNRTFWQVDQYLPPVLLRLYEEAPHGSEMREKCLDAWDLLLKARVASVVSLTDRLGA